MKILKEQEEKKTQQNKKNRVIEGSARKQFIKALPSSKIGFFCNQCRREERGRGEKSGCGRAELNSSIVEREWGNFDGPILSGSNMIIERG